MKKFLKRLAIVLCLTLAWMYRPYTSYDLEKVSPELTSLREPFQYVEGCLFMDGGSLSIHIIDADGLERFFCLPGETPSGDEPYQNLYTGARHYREEGSREIPLTDDTKYRLHEILKEARGINATRHVTIGHLSGRSRDIVCLILRRITGRYPEFQNP